MTLQPTEPTEEPSGLTIAVNLLADQARDVRAQLRSRTRALWVAIAVGAVAIAMTGDTSRDTQRISEENRAAIAENNRRWCPLVSTLAPRPDDPPPVGDAKQVERALRVRAALTQLLSDFDCRENQQ